MTYQVIIQPNAEADIAQAFRWIAQRAPEYAVPWYHGLQERILSLRTFPERCPLAPEDTYFTAEIRQLLYGRRPNVYRILFTVVGDTVHILHVRHGAQDVLRGDGESMA